MNKKQLKSIENMQKELTTILFKNQEFFSRHNPYEQERREQKAIQNGNLEQLEQSWEENYQGQIGTLAGDPLRHARNHGIVLITLASRSAIEGGVIPEIAFSLTDLYIQRMESMSSPFLALELARQAEYHFASLVNEMKTEKLSGDNYTDARILQCENYVFSHLHEKISLTEMAKETYLNKNYLCELFRREKGITIGEYIIRQKIKFIQNMLIYSDYSYSEIATYFGFSSQSHLGKQFKKETGMTLRQYRLAFQKQ